MQHHPVFSRLEPFSGVVPPFWVVDYLGTRIRHEFVAGLIPARTEPEMVEKRYPEFDEEYFEWIDLCEAVVAARGSFTMIELGAGFGRWAVRAARAIERFHPGMPCRLVAVEAEPQVFEWMRLHFEDNGIDPAAHTLINAAISDQPGRALFYIGGPSAEYKAGSWYGQALTKPHEQPGASNGEEYCGYRVERHPSGWKSIRVKSLSLRSILKDLERVDLIDMDIEGEELSAVRGAIDDLDAKAKRLHIGTHSAEIEAELRQILTSHGWISLADYPLFTRSGTPFGSISFQNGAQSWLNPRLK